MEIVNVLEKNMNINQQIPILVIPIQAIPIQAIHELKS
jgi:hypothetical protein